MKLMLAIIPFALLSNTDYCSDDTTNSGLNPNQDTLKITNQIAFEIYNGDTINRTNEHGYRVGVWYRFPDSISNLTYKYYFSGESGALTDRVWSETYYPNGIKKSRLNQNRDTSWYYNDQGLLEMMLIRSNYIESKIQTYYPTGQLASECFYYRQDLAQNETDQDSCKCWTETGIRIANCP